MHHRILRHLLTLFFVLVLLTLMSLPMAATENGSTVKENLNRENENYIYRSQKYPEKNQMEIKIY
ncbi:MAG: hypothetical protein UZ05_CHB002000226 [Chlorobi bacterium OLB5]|nr:MAG: hypothetical protein UZ05_CHB002000226 [Chlorobi bacterium OLB5]